MANPFSMFRRKQRTLLAVFGVLIMISFVFSGAFNMGSGPARQNPVIVSTNYGAVHEQEMSGLIQSRNLVDIFLQHMVGATVESLVQQKKIDPRSQQRVLQGMYGQLKGDLMQRSVPQPEAAAIETMVLAKKAEQLGIVVSDKTINAYLKEITADSLTGASIMKIISEMKAPDNSRVSQAELFEGLRTELLASRVSRMVHFGGGSTTPAQRWEYYQRLNRRLSAQVLAVPVAGFVKEVEDPTKEQVAQFYADHREQYNVPGQPEPGFKEPRKAKFQYFKADYERFLAEQMPKVTDEEIAAYYEKNKDTQFKQRALPFDDDKSKTKTDDKDKEDAKEEAKEDGEKPVNDKPAADAPGDTPDAGAAPTDKVEDKKADEKKDDKPADEAKEAPKPDDKSGARVKPRSLVRLVSDSKADDAPAATADAPAADAKPTDDAKPADADKPADPDAAKPADGDKSADEKAAGDDKPAEKKEEVTYDPLEKVSDQIRRQLAAGKVHEVVDKAFADLTDKMAAYSQDRVLYEAKKLNNPDSVPPKALDFAALAKENNVAAKETALISPIEARDDTDLGKSYNFTIDDRAQFNFRKITFVETAFGEGMQLYKPSKGEDEDQNFYLYWKTEDKPEEIPPLDEIREQVVAAWKLVEARKPAEKKAEEYAAQARKSKSSLMSMFNDKKGLKVTETGMFSWLTTGSVAMDPNSNVPRESEVKGVEYPGDDFMKAVFSLEQAGDICVAMNLPKSVVYVVEILDIERPTAELEKDFATEDYRRYQMVASDDQRQVFGAWMAGINKEAGVDWKRQPNESRRGR